DVTEICARIEYYYRRPAELYALAERGQRAFRRVFDLDAQMAPRFRALEAAMGG
ncbi:MAG: hypothetical protein HY784_06705, partial [Chloroflexi bacterium]|nr:hypothetical protein [Chloroflexota bacterium]